MADVDQATEEQPEGPLLRDGPFPPGYIDPIEDSDILQDPAATNPASDESEQ